MLDYNRRLKSIAAREKVIDMFPDFSDELFEDRINARMDVMYIVFDKTDQEYQGLYKIAETKYIDKRGMTAEFKHKVEAGDILLIEMFFEDECRLLKTCCEVKSCESKDANIFETRIEFIIIKENDKAFWENYIFKKMETLMKAGRQYRG
jgi:hypothetical protein